MSRSKLPQSAADWFAAVFTLVTVVAVVGLIAAVPQDFRGAASPAAGTTPARQGHECGHLFAPAVSNYLPAHFMGRERAATESVGRC